jgi:hypothetical protein
MRKAGNGTLDSELTLTDPNGNVVAANNNYNDQDAQLIYLIPADGQYQIVAQSYNSNSSGAYRLRLVHGDNVGEDLAQSVPILRLGVAEQGIVPPNGAQAWQFQGEAGDEVTISVQALEEGFDPLLILYGLDGAEIANDDDRGGGLNPSLTVTLPESGTYTASITSYDGSNGRYMIRISHP